MSVLCNEIQLFDVKLLSPCMSSSIDKLSKKIMRYVQYESISIKVIWIRSQNEKDHELIYFIALVFYLMLLHIFYYNHFITCSRSAYPIQQNMRKNAFFSLKMALFLQILMSRSENRGFPGRFFEESIPLVQEKI